MGSRFAIRVCLLASVLFTPVAFANDVLQSISDQRISRFNRLNIVYGEYAKRFDVSHRYISSWASIHSFRKLQDAFIAQLKTENAIKEVLHFDNDFRPNLWIKLYLINDNAGNFLAFYYEKSEYRDIEEESYLRLVHQGQLDVGLKFIKVMNTYALKINGSQFKPELGGGLEISYPRNLRNDEWETLHLQVVKKDAEWMIVTQGYAQVRRALIKVWTQYFPPNGGISGIQLF